MAREALSARIDGEALPVPAARVDEHLEQCADCRAWLDGVTAQSAQLRRLVEPPVSAARAPIDRRRTRSLPRTAWQRWALLGVGVTQIALGVAQALGMSVGLTHVHGMDAGGHLLNESTAWSITLGLVMVIAARWPQAAAGLAIVLAVFAGVLTGYVIADATAGAVTLTRILTHLPIIVGVVLAILVWRGAMRPHPTPRVSEEPPDIVLPHNASRGRRRGHLWSTDGAA